MEDRNAPATKGDLTDLETRLTERHEQLRAEFNQLRGEFRQQHEQLRGEFRQQHERLRGEMLERNEQLRTEVNHGYNDIVERIHDAQTALLTAFYSYAQGNNKRVTELEGNEGAFRSRLATLEDRMLEVERRLNIPPAA
ncbi:MAG TPA: hypothetical protein VHB50_12460 [Bryobacteraceae bacterium]|nr:hypothetical protein [Bryobacteraceae bacterium]